MVVLELQYLKMEVTVSEPCDVIRVAKSCIFCVNKFLIGGTNI